MSAPFTLFGQLPGGWVPWTAWTIGIGFGWCLERGGLGAARKLAGQFYLTDLTVFKVMFSALVTAMIGIFWLGRLGVLDPRLLDTPQTFLVPMLVGGLLFGVGFLIGGLCPGTSCVSAATGRLDGMLVMLGMLIGVLGFMELHPILEAFHNSTARGTSTLPGLVGLSPGLVAALVSGLALAGFAGAERIAPSGSTRPGLRRLLLVAALVLAGGAAVPFETGTKWPGLPDSRAFDEPLELARAIRDGDPGVQIVDVRSPGAFEQFHLPRAVNIPASNLADLKVEEMGPILVYGFDTEDGLRGAWILEGSGLRDVRVLRGGATAWMREVMLPWLPLDATAEERAAFGEIADLSWYFGGNPVRGPGAAASESLDALLQRAQTVSCGW